MRPGGRPGNFLHGVASEGLVPAVIQKGTITAVDPDAYTVEVSTLVGKRRFVNMPIPSLYAHPFSGEGVHVMPDVGAELSIVVPSDGDVRAFPLMYQPPVNELASMAGSRPPLNPGDIVLQGREGNAVRVRRGGAVEIESSPTCRTIFLPRESKIVTVAEAMSIQTLAGSLDWYVGEKDELPDGNRVANLSAKLKTSATHKWSSIDIDIGGEIREDGSPPVVISQYASGDVDKEDDRVLVSRIRLTPNGVDVRLADGKTHDVGSIDGDTRENNILGRSYLERLDSVLDEIKGQLSVIAAQISLANGQGGTGNYTPATPLLDALRADIDQSLSSNAPLLSAFSRVE